MGNVDLMYIYTPSPTPDPATLEIILNGDVGNHKVKV